MGNRIVLPSCHSTTTSQVEKSPYCQKLIQQRICDGLADPGTIYDDVSQCRLSEKVDGFLAGFPCQGVSKAGLGHGLADQRSALLSHVWRLWDQQPEPPRLWINLASYIVQQFPLTKISDIQSMNSIRRVQCKAMEWLRKFAVLENVGVIIHQKQRPMLQYLLQESLFTWLFVLNISHISAIDPFLSPCPVASPARRPKCVAFGWPGPLWMARWLVRRLAPHKKYYVFFSKSAIRFRIWTNVQFHIWCTEIWRERVFFFVARPDFQFFQAPTCHISWTDSNKTRQPIISLYQPISAYIILTPPCQGFDMADPESLRNMPAKKWMANSRRVALEEWLAPSQTGKDRERLCSIGNVVVPRMGFFAMNILKEMWTS